MPPSLRLKHFGHPVERCAFCSGDPSDEMKKLEYIEILFDQALELQMEVTDQIQRFNNNVISHLKSAVDKFEEVADAVDIDHLPIIEVLIAAIIAEYDSFTTPLNSFEFWDRVREINEDTHPVHLDICQNYISDYHKQEINEMIVSQLYREYDFDIGNSLLTEYGEPVDKMSDLRSQFEKLQEITNAVKGMSVELPLEWISDNRERLGQAGSELEFKLHVLKFIEILKTYSGPSDTRVLQYARDHISRYSNVHMSEIQKLMGCLVLERGRVGPVHRRYAYLFDESYRLNIIEEIGRQFYILSGQCCTSPLRAVTSAGAKVLSGLCKAADILWDDGRVKCKSLMDVPLYAMQEDEFKIHSQFVCPLTGEVMKAGVNPPIALVCGHVFIKRTILYYASEHNNWEMECPICSTVTIPPGYKTVYF
ncbi:hypothetical protein QQ045_026345 [Rhodiola kirilowii]